MYHCIGPFEEVIIYHCIGPTEESYPYPISSELRLKRYAYGPIELVLGPIEEARAPCALWGAPLVGAVASWCPVAVMDSLCSCMARASGAPQAVWRHVPTATDSSLISTSSTAASSISSTHREPDADQGCDCPPSSDRRLLMLQSLSPPLPLPWPLPSPPWPPPPSLSPRPRHHPHRHQPHRHPRRLHPRPQPEAPVWFF